jgi:hypothetical protein
MGAPPPPPSEFIYTAEEVEPVAELRGEKVIPIYRSIDRPRIGTKPIRDVGKTEPEPKRRRWFRRRPRTVQQELGLGE